jgi:hypothetical protein
LRIIPIIGVIYGLKRYFGGASNRSERVMHSKVVMITVRYCLAIREPMY